MQGRGSGTGYERIASEYIASQFRQFGLEPGGDNDETGSKGFVQKVQLQTVKFTEAPTLTAVSPGATKTLQFGRDFSVTTVRSPELKGQLQIIDVNETPTRGAIVLFKSAENLEAQKRQDLTRKARMAQATAILLLESEANRQIREAAELKLPTLPSNILGDSSPSDAFAVISLSKESFQQLQGMPNGSTIEFQGKTEATNSGTTWNAIGILRGSDPQAAKDILVLSAHLDHLGASGIGTDAVFNGADDNASGCVAVLELARVLATTGKRPRRTIYFVCFGSEERGGYGARYFSSHSGVPLERIVADINFEMLGRPDAKVAADTLWLTGYERSDLGPTLAKRGARLVADPHPQQNFFQRSDNYRLALRGVVAHTVSSYGLHTDYHRPSDDLSKIDFPFMTRSINSMIAPIRWLANSNFRPEWLPGKSPQAG
jgi:hypothetical protein